MFEKLFIDILPYSTPVLLNGEGQRTYVLYIYGNLQKILSTGEHRGLPFTNPPPMVEGKDTMCPIFFGNLKQNPVHWWVRDSPPTPTHPQT